MSSIMGDLGVYLPADATKTIEAKHSTNKKAGTELDMLDYLMLMVTSLQNQTIDDTMSMSDMMNQMSTMSMMQAITNLNDTLSETSSMSYAASLVGKEVTVAISGPNGTYEYTGKVTGVSVLNGEPIIFIGNDMFYLSDIIAIGRLPSEIEDELPKADGDDVEGSEGGGSGDGDSEIPSGGESGVEADGGTGTYYGFSFNENDFEYRQDDNGAIRIVYKGEDGVSGMGVTEQIIPGGTAAANPGVAAASGTGAQQSATQEQRSAEVKAAEETEEAEPVVTFEETGAQQSSAGAEAAAAEWLAENG